MLRILTIVFALCASRAVCDDDYPILIYPCPKATVAPVIDGKLEDAVWSTAPLVSGFLIYETGLPATPPTAFRLLWDDQNIYLAVRCDEPMMEKTMRVRYAHDEHAVFSSETIEFFIDPDHTHERYYQVAFNLLGSLYDGAGTDTSWNSQAVVKTFLGQDFWTAEIAVPWAPMQTKPREGKVVGFNVNRDRHLEGRGWHTWSRVSLDRGFHDVERFAHLVLSATPDTLARLSEEFRKGGRTGPLTLFSAEGFAQTTYKKLAEEAFALCEGMLSKLRLECQRENNPRVIAQANRCLDSYQSKLADVKATVTETIDAAQWTRLDLALQEWMKTLGKVIAETRLQVLLDDI
jgi:hypothetical protein